MKHRNLIAVIKNFVIFLIIYLLLSFMAVMLIYEGLFARTEPYGYSMFISRDDIEQQYAVRDVKFDSCGFSVSAAIYGETKDKLVILGHAKDGSSADILPEARFFLENGFSVMTMDFVGHSNSEGNSQSGLHQSVYDMENAIGFARSEGFENIYLYGIGIGGYAAASCADEEGVRGVASISAYSSIQDLTLEYAVDKMSILGYLEYPIMLLYQQILYGDDMKNNAVEGINSSDVPVIIINGTADDKVKYDGAALINAADRITNENVIYKTVENGVHLSLMRTEEARNLIDKFNEDAYMLYYEHDGNVPVAAIEDLYDAVDREAASQLDAGLMNEILSVFSCS